MYVIDNIAFLFNVLKHQIIRNIRVSTMSDKINVGRRNRRSRFDQANTTYHSNDGREPKRNKINPRRVDIDTYRGLCIKACNKHQQNNDGKANCLYQHFNDSNTVISFANIFCSKINGKSISEWNNVCHNLVHSFSSIKNNSRSHMKYHIVVDDGVHIPCCKMCFMRVYQITEYMLDHLKKTHVDDDINYRKEDNEKSSNEKREFVELLNEHDLLDVDFATTCLPLVFSPDTAAGELCTSWMLVNFYLYGDANPGGRILYTAEDCKEEYYQMYVQDIAINDPVSLDNFLLIWNNCFPYVIMRDDVNQVGKCKKCAAISSLRAKKDNALKLAGKNLKILHRGLFKEERDAMNQRLFHTYDHPEDIFHVLIDIMGNKDVCKTPNTGSQNLFPKQFKSIIVGALTHGSNKELNIDYRQKMRIFRSYDTVKKSGDLIIHCFMRCLEEWINGRNGKHPSLIYVQIDGGSENANHTFLCHMQYLIFKKFCSTIIISRLPTGHGHTQLVDGCFGLIRTLIGGMNLAGVTDFEEIIRKK